MPEVAADWTPLPEVAMARRPMPVPVALARIALPLDVTPWTPMLPVSAPVV